MGTHSVMLLELFSAKALFSVAVAANSLLANITVFKFAHRLKAPDRKMDTIEGMDTVVMPV